MSQKTEDAIDTVINLNHQDPAKLVEIARRSFNEERTKDVKFRRSQLNNLAKFLEENEEAIIAAIFVDLKKPKQEAITLEVLPLLKELKQTLNYLNEWTKPQRPTKSLINCIDDVLIYNDPYGVVLVMGAWNYPLGLTLKPVIGAIAAGNCVVIKPSDLSPATSRLLYDILPRYLDSDCYPVFLGGVEETTELLKERFDYIFYTGGTAVGRIVHQAANKYLTPTTLELGGKSPAYIDSTANMETTVKRILWGKGVNCGQICIAPDYILCSKEDQDKFVKVAERIIPEFYGSDMRLSLDFCRIINDKHFERLTQLMKGLKIAVGGRTDQKDRFIELTIATDVSPNHPIMQEEIFGPILPIVIVNSVHEAVKFIRAREKPLALYIFSKNKKDCDYLLETTSSGGVCVNDTLLHYATDGLPFGGVGYSGMGAYHGKHTFDTFTHKKGVLVKNFGSIPEKIMAARYPPYSNSKISLMKIGLTEKKRLRLPFLSYIVVFILGVVITLIVYYVTGI